MMLNPLLHIFVFLNFQISIPEQTDFEGIVTYHHEYSIDSLSRFYGEESTYFFKKGNYKQVFNGQGAKLSIYDVGKNEIVSVISQDTIVTDCGLKSEDILDYEIIENSEKVLDELCHVLIIKTDRRVTHYFYSDNYKVRPSFMENHKYGSLSFIYSKIKALPLRIVTYYPSFSIKMTAIAVKEKELSDKLFTL